MKTKLAGLVFASLVLALVASTIAPAYAVGTSADSSYQVAQAVNFRLFDPDNTHYYGPPDFYTPFGYHTYSRYLNPPPPVWIPPPPMTLAPYVVSRWVDVDRLTVAWTGETRRTKRIAVTFFDKSRTLRAARPAGPLFQPYRLTYSPPASAAFMRVRTYDGAGRVLKDILASVPPQ
jgi:hypothetical protein